jgi:hypothetical protein
VLALILNPLEQTLMHASGIRFSTARVIYKMGRERFGLNANCGCSDEAEEEWIALFRHAEWMMNADSSIEWCNKEGHKRKGRTGQVKMEISVISAVKLLPWWNGPRKIRDAFSNPDVVCPVAVKVVRISGALGKRPDVTGNLLVACAFRLAYSYLTKAKEDTDDIDYESPGYLGMPRPSVNFLSPSPQHNSNNLSSTRFRRTVVPS